VIFFSYRTIIMQHKIKVMPIVMYMEAIILYHNYYINIGNSFPNAHGFFYYF